MHVRVAINFGGRGLEYFSLNALSQSKHVDCTYDTRFRRLHRVELIMDGRSRAGQIINLINFYKQWMGDIMTQEFETFVIKQMSNVGPTARKEVINAEDFAATSYQA